MEIFRRGRLNEDNGSDRFHQDNELNELSQINQEESKSGQQMINLAREVPEIQYLWDDDQVWNK